MLIDKKNKSINNKFVSIFDIKEIYFMKIWNKVIRFILVLLLIVVTQSTFMPVPTAYAATSPSLGTAATYSITAGTSVTNAGASTLGGSVGISPGAGGSPNYTGFSGGNTVTLGGSIDDANGAALTAMNDRNATFTALVLRDVTLTTEEAEKI